MMRRLVPTCLALIVCAQAATVEGVLRDNHGAVVTGGTVQLENLNDPTANRFTRTDAAGHFRFTSLAAARYTLHAEKSALGPFRLAADETKTTDLVLASKSDAIEYFDEPKFTVAGVTDHTYVGGHGSDAAKRSSEQLTAATEALRKDANQAETMPSLEKATQADPANADLHRSLAEAQEASGHPLAAVHEYQRAAELDPSETNLFDWATELLIHAAPGQALAVYHEAIRLHPGRARLLLGAGTACYSEGDYDEAARFFFKAVDLDPNDSMAYRFLAQLDSTSLKQSPDLLARMQRYAERQPPNAWALYLYAAALWNARDAAAVNARVLSLLRQATELDPQLAPAFLQMGIVYAAEGNLSAAISACQKAVELDGNLEGAHYRLAQLYRQTGDPQKAQSEEALFRSLSRSSSEKLADQRARLQQFVITLAH